MCFGASPPRGSLYGERADDCSKNGTFVNNEAVEVLRLVNGDCIRLGDQVLAFVGDMARPKHPLRLDSKLLIDEMTWQVWQERQELAARLTPQEFDLLANVAKRPEKVCSRSEIGDHILDLGTYDNALLYQLIRRLRARIERVPDDTQYVTIVPHIGYRLSEVLQL